MSLKQLGRIYAKFVSVVISTWWQLRKNLLSFHSALVYFSFYREHVLFLTIWNSMEHFLCWTKERFYSPTKISLRPWLSRIATPVSVSPTILHAACFSSCHISTKSTTSLFQGRNEGKLKNQEYRRISYRSLHFLPNPVLSPVSPYFSSCHNHLPSCLSQRVRAVFSSSLHPTSHQSPNSPNYTLGFSRVSPLFSVPMISKCRSGCLTISSPG